MSTAALPPAGAREVRTERLVASRSAVARARSVVTDTLRSWHVEPAAVDDAELVVSELVTNAFLHGGADDVTVTVADTGPVVRLEVVHREQPGDAADTPLVPMTVDPREVHGRGLAIVDVLASRWGVDESDGARRVWTELAAARAGLLPADRREPALADLQVTLAAAAAPRAVADAVAGWGRGRLAAGFVGVALPDTDPGFLRYVAVDPLPAASAAAWARFPVGTDAPVAAAYRDGHAFFHESRNAAVAAFPALGPALVESEMAALVHLPLCSESGAVLGALALAWSHGRLLDADDRRWLTTVAAATAAALVRVGVGRG